MLGCLEHIERLGHGARQPAVEEWRCVCAKRPLRMERDHMWCLQRLQGRSMVRERARSHERMAKPAGGMSPLRKQRLRFESH